MKALFQFILMGGLMSGFLAGAEAQNCLPPPAGLIGWWKGDGNAADTVAGNNGTLVNAGFTNGMVGQAFAFDPENQPGTYTGVQIADQPVYALTNSLTIECWVRPRGDGYMIFWRGDSRPGLDPYSLSMEGNNELWFGINDANNNSAVIGTTLNYDVWTHVAATLDGSTGTLSLYTNGMLAAQMVTDVRPFGELVPDDHPGIGIGNDNDGLSNFGFYGDIDEVSLYNRALTPAEITAIYNAGSAGKCEVAFPPVIVAQPAGASVAEGGEADLSVVAGGSGPLTYQWTFNGAILNGATNSAFSVTNIHPTQAGNYAVKVTSPYGSVTSSNAVVTVNSLNVLIYTYNGTENDTATGSETSYNYSGQMFYYPDLTNGVFVGWAVIAGKKEYWVTTTTNYLLISVNGKNKDVYTLLGRAGEEFDQNNQPHLWSYLHKGLNATLTIATKKTYSFPSTLKFNSTDTYADPDTGNMVLREASSTYEFSGANTTSANNGGKTQFDLITALINSLVKQGYQPQ